MNNNDTLPSSRSARLPVSVLVHGTSRTQIRSLPIGYALGHGAMLATWSRNVRNLFRDYLAPHPCPLLSPDSSRIPCYINTLRSLPLLLNGACVPIESYPLAGPGLQAQRYWVCGGGAAGRGINPLPAP